MEEGPISVILIGKMSLKGEGSVNSRTAKQFLTPVGGEDCILSTGSRSGSSTLSSLRSLRHYLTREELPRESNYRNVDSIVGGDGGRPSLKYLHDETLREKPVPAGGKEEEKKKLRGKVVKFGWKEGVLMRCLLNIWGVMLFLRLSWVIGEAGIIFGILVVLLGNCITTITAISMSAVATNGQIKAGGIYYMISRSLGPEFGGSIGLLFTVANSIAAATYIIGFVNGLQDMFKEYFDDYEIIPGTGGGLNDVRVLGTITLVGVLALAIVGMDWVTRVQMGLLFLLIASQVDFLVGAFMGPVDDKERSRGFVGFDGDVFSENAKTDYRYYEGEQNFFTVFGVFFTAVTGIVAGANLSGDLKDPAASIPKGTLLAILTTCCTYVIYPFFMGGAVVRDASGNESMYKSYSNLPVYDNPCFNRSYCANETCDYGLQNSFQIMELMSAWGPLIYMGTYAATLSSAIASLVGAPRVLQALAKDRLYPYIHIFEVGWGANNDPVRGYVLVFLISFACVMVGELNAVSTLLTNCFLASYSLINFSCFHASFIRSPGWRPSFKYYSLYVSLIGGVLCLCVMFLIDWITALVTFAAAIILYMYVRYRQPDVNWGSSIQGQSYLSALKSTLDLVKVPENVKNFRPQILLLSGNPAFRPSLVHFAYNITNNVSFLACANIKKGPLTQKLRTDMTDHANQWLEKQKIRSFYTILEAKNIEEGSRYLFQLVGLGKLRPNMVLLGFKSDWRDCDNEELNAYFNTLHEAFNLHLGLAILRISEGFDCSNVLQDKSFISINEAQPVCVVNIEITPPDNDPPTDNIGETNEKIEHKIVNEQKEDNSEEKPNKGAAVDNLYKGIEEAQLPKSVVQDLNRFKTKQPKGTIDVWWLYDDGGLTILLPYILTTRSQWSSCKLRVFALANRKNEIDQEQRSMANLLSKFRIDVKDMIIIPDLAKKAEQKSHDEFNEMISKFRNMNAEKNGMFISDVELSSQEEKTNRHLRLREILLENSKDSTLVVMTLPMPRKNTVSAPLYMAWIETLTKDLPPFLLIRGNQQSVLTFYS
ncbi:UNVERIFIED_CONTAM: hypothetical protein RMT77_010147 [Armadillidium vulgare]